MKGLRPEHKALIQSNPCLAQVSTETQQSIAESVYVKTLSKGQLLHRRGDDAVGYYGVVSGRLRISALSQDGKALTLCFMQSGDWFGEISLVDAKPRTHDCEVTKNCELLIIPKTSFEQYLLEDTQSLRHITQHICQRLRRALSFIEQVTIQPLPERIARRLLDLLDLNGEHIKLNQQELAQMMGVSRQSISKILLSWAQSDWIKIEYNHVTIQQAESLRTLCVTNSVPQAIHQ
ncbi:Crp/Fnr family transcriptional regulator [Pseudomonas sp. HK3]